jgi:hypothetical protein
MKTALGIWCVVISVLVRVGDDPQPKFVVILTGTALGGAIQAR